MCEYGTCYICLTKKIASRKSSFVFSFIRSRIKEDEGPSPEERLEKYVKERQRVREVTE